MSEYLTIRKINENILKIKEFMFSKKFENLQIYSRQYYFKYI